MKKNNNNNGGSKAAKSAQKLANQVASLRNEIQQLKQVGNGAVQMPKKARKRKAAQRAPASGPNGPPIAGFFAPVSEGTIMKSVKPVFTRVSRDEQRIVHREKVVKLTTPGTGVFTVLASIALNPGLAASFPWLSNEAAGWESYRFNRMRFIWVPTSGTAVAGNIIMAPDYDAADSAPVGETFMSSYTDCEEANVWARFAAEMDPDYLNGQDRRKYVRVGALGSNLDIKTYDSGNFFVVSADDATANSGKLWVEYDITLYNPQVPPGGFQAAGTLLGATMQTSADPFGTASVASGSLALSNASGVVRFGNVQVGQEIAVTAAFVGTGIAGWTPVLSGITLRSNNGSINAGATNTVSLFTYTVTAPNPTWAVGMIATTVTSALLVVTVLAPIPTF